MQLKRNIKYIVVLLTSTYSAWVLAQAQPQANGAALGSATEAVSATRTTTNTTPTATTGGGTAGVDETAPSEVTTMDPMDPARDAREAERGDMRNRRARAPASGTVAPDTTAPQTVPNSTY
ncbi:MAG: hypothetical protein NDI63_04425 [Pseudobdellovibrio sp.]|nr:hypothetical protein [Pseudobdellovibrio sp.]